MMARATLIMLDETALFQKIFVSLRKYCAGSSREYVASKRPGMRKCDHSVHSRPSCLIESRMSVTGADDGGLDAGTLVLCSTFCPAKCPGSNTRSVSHVTACTSHQSVVTTRAQN